MKAKQVILSRLLPKTGQETVYEVGDDGTIQAGWWKGLKVANNRERFAPFASGGKTLVRDKATGLIWPADWGDINFGLGASGYFDNLFNVWLPAMNAAAYGGFSDWRIPNVFELVSLTDFGRVGRWIDTDIFDNVELDKYWTGTTDKDYTTWAFALDLSYFGLYSALKTSYQRRIACREGL